MKDAAVDRYLAQCPPEHRKAIEAIRGIAHRTRADVAESIQYKMPTFTVGGRTLCGVSSRANYVALYCEPTVVEKHQAGLSGLDVGKSCIRFRRLEDLDLPTVQKILAEIAAGTSPG